MSKKVTFSLNRYLVTLISLIVVIMTLAILVLPTRLYESLYAAQAENYCKNIAVQTSTGISYALYDFDVKIDQLIDEPVMRAIVQSPLSDAGQYQDFHNLIADYLQPRSMDQYYVQTIDLYVRSTGTSFSYGSKPTRLDDPFHSTYLQEALVYPMELNWIGYQPAVDCIDIARLIYNKDTYEIQGLLVIRISVEFLLDKFNAFNTINIEQMYIADEKGLIMSAKDKAALGTTVAYADLIKNRTSRTISDSQELVIFSRLEDVAAAFPYEKWSTIITINKAVLFRDMHRILNFLYAFALVIAILGIAAAIFIASQISRPIDRLVHAMGQAQQGDLSISLATKSPIREVSLFNHGFNEMAAKLNNLINTVYKIQIVEKEAQLRSLRSQINPHFLFNTLQLISWQAHNYEADPVCDMIHSLSYMLESDLYSTDEHTFTLREELKYIGHYAKIIQCKYLDKIRIDIDVPDELLDCKIPKLIIQPFIENSVTHGLAPKTSAGFVSLRIWHDWPAGSENGDLAAVIADDGVGIRQNTLQAIQQSLRQPASQPPADGPGSQAGEAGHRIALANIQHRIHLLYGDAYGFTIDSDLARGTVVTLRIPYLVVKETLHD